METEAAQIIRTFAQACYDAWDAADYVRVHHLACTAIAALDELGVRSAGFEDYKHDAEFRLTFDEVSL